MCRQLAASHLVGNPRSRREREIEYLGIRAAAAAATIALPVIAAADRADHFYAVAITVPIARHRPARAREQHVDDFHGSKSGQRFCKENQNKNYRGNVLDSSDHAIHRHLNFIIRNQLPRTDVDYWTRTALGRLESRR
jgi:hypothetical protein